MIVLDLTWIATAAPITYVDATPVADCDEKTWCLSSDAFQDCITPKIKAVIPVDLYGNMPEMDAIGDIAHDHSIAIIEDTAEAIGSEYHGKRAGSFGDPGVFSFHGSKTMTNGEEGMLVTDRKDLYDCCLALRDHGREPGEKMLRNAEVGYKYKMGSMQAALGLAQLERIEELVERKRQILVHRCFEWVMQKLSSLQ